MSEITPIPVKELLIEATFAPNRALRAGVEAIDLGAIGEEAERIHDKSASVSRLEDRIEYKVPVIVTPDKRLLLRKEEIAGTQTNVVSVFEVGINSKSNMVPKDQRQDRFLATNIHNHTIPTPPSPVDFVLLFSEDIDPVACTAVSVSSTLEKIVIFRGESTPGWKQSFTVQKVALWEEMMKERGYKFLKSGMSVNEKINLNRLIQMAWLRDVIAKYDLEAFSCPLRENIARRMVFS